MIPWIDYVFGGSDDVSKSKMSRNKDFWLMDNGFNQVFFLFNLFFIVKECDGLI